MASIEIGPSFTHYVCVVYLLLIVCRPMLYKDGHTQTSVIEIHAMDTPSFVCVCVFGFLEVARNISVKLQKSKI